MLLLHATNGNILLPNLTTALFLGQLGNFAIPNEDQRRYNGFNKKQKTCCCFLFPFFSLCFPRNSYFLCKFPNTMQSWFLFKWLLAHVMSCHVLPAEEIPLEMFALMRIVPGGIDRALLDLCEWWEHRNDKVQRLNTLPNFTIAPEKLPSQWESSLPTTIFQGLC